MRNVFLVLALVLAGCGCNEEEKDNPFVCETADDCYEGVDPADLPGEIVCHDRVEGGYCTHLCTADDECCSVEGECDDEFLQVCAPLESSPDMYCFYSCEDVDLPPDMGADEFCAEYAHWSFHCRSTGGGTDNRRVCLP